jgi:hypothetical protein
MPATTHERPVRPPLPRGERVTHAPLRAWVNTHPTQLPHHLTYA